VNDWVRVNSCPLCSLCRGRVWVLTCFLEVNLLGGVYVCSCFVAVSWYGVYGGG
jgi:hypothetical protein